MIQDIAKLEEKANEIRVDIIKMLEKAGSGHSAGPLGMADIFTALYFNIMHNDPQNPLWEDRDRLFLSAGHTVPVRYVTMAHAGYFDKKKLNTLRKLGSDLQGHPERKRMSALESTSGPLGSGLAQAAGYAYAARMDRKRFRTYCVCSDGEHQEGNHWEAVMFAGNYRLSNLTVFVDRNNIQIDGYTEQVMPLEPLAAKYEAFNWHVLHINGHNMQEIIDAVGHARAVYEKPTVIICHTIPGKGVDFMENDYKWHGMVPNHKQEVEAIKELRTLGGKIKSEHE
jgi:transketolase